MSKRVWVITEGETYHVPWLVHLVATNEQVARRYARDLVAANESQRWPNIEVHEFEIDVPGALETWTAPLPCERDG